MLAYSWYVIISHSIVMVLFWKTVDTTMEKVELTTITTDSEIYFNGFKEKTISAFINRGYDKVIKHET